MSWMVGVSLIKAAKVCYLWHNGYATPYADITQSFVFYIVMM